MTIAERRVISERFAPCSFVDERERERERVEKFVVGT